MKTNKNIFNALASALPQVGVSVFESEKDWSKMAFRSRMGEYEIKIYEKHYAVFAFFKIDIPNIVGKEKKDRIEEYLNLIGENKWSHPCYGKLIFDRKENKIFYTARIKCGGNFEMNKFVETVCEGERMLSLFTKDIGFVLKGHKTPEEVFKIARKKYIRQEIWRILLFRKRKRKIPALNILFKELVSPEK